MARGEVSVVIERPAAEVFAVLCDVEQNHRWSSTAREGHPTSDGPIGVGSTAREVSVFLGRRITVDSRVVEFVADRTLGYVTSGGPFPFRGRFVVEPRGHATCRVEATFEARLSGALRLVDPLFAILARRTLASDLAGLKRLVESPERQP
jgi:hypothetical protein